MAPLLTVLILGALWVRSSWMPNSPSSIASFIKEGDDIMVRGYYMFRYTYRIS